MPHGATKDPLSHTATKELSQLKILYAAIKPQSSHKKKKKKKERKKAGFKELVFNFKFWYLFKVWC